MLSLFSPDFFGNPVTGNFWGKIGYQESTGYFGIVVLTFFIYGAYKAIKDKHPDQIFLLILFFASLILIIDSPVSRFIYTYKIPILSTSYATRIFLITDFSAAILAVYGFSKLKNNKSLILRVTTYTLAILIGIELGVAIVLKIAKDANLLDFNKYEIINYSIAFKNTLVPIGIVFALLTVIKVFFNKKYFFISFIIFLTLIDLLRFDMKFNILIDRKLIYSSSPIFDFLQNNLGFYRFDKERAEIIPPNTWIPYKIMSPSGYDPLHTLNYSYFHNLYNNRKPDSGASRYEELSSYTSPIVDLAGVKYIAAIRRNSLGIISQTDYAYPQELKDSKFKRAFEDKSVIILENTSVMPRVNLFEFYDVENNSLLALYKLHQGYDFRKRIILDKDVQIQRLKVSLADQAKITDYSSNQVTISSKTDNPSILMLTDAYYPGWEARVDGIKTKIYQADGIFRAIILPSGSHKIIFNYKPLSFKLGLTLSLSSAFILLILFFLSKKKKLYF